jgi:prephenate dehydrogenase
MILTILPVSVTCASTDLSQADPRFHETIERISLGFRPLQSDLNLIVKMIGQSPNTDTLDEYASILNTLEKCIVQEKINELKAHLRDVRRGFN